MRMPIAVAVSAMLVAGCATASGVPSPASPTPTQDPRPSTPLSSASPGPIQSPGATPSPAAVLPDRYPPELIGRLFFLAGSDPRDITVGRIGLSGGLSLGPTNQFRGNAGDLVVTTSRPGNRPELRRWSFAAGGQLGEAIELDVTEDFAGIAEGLVVTVTPSGTGTLLRLWSTTTGAEVGHGIDVASISDPRPIVLGSNVILVSSIGEDGSDGGVAVVSTVDGSVRVLVGPSKVNGLTHPERVLVVSNDATQLATTVCSTGIDFVGECRPIAFVEIGTGKGLKTLDLGGRQPVLVSSDWFLVGSVATTEVLDPQGREVWSTRPLGLGAGPWAMQLGPDGRLVLEVRSIAGNVQPVLLAVDPLTGQQTTLYGPDVAADWHVWPLLSTERLVAIGDSDFSPPCMNVACGPDELRVADASTLDLATGKLTPHAIHITFAP